MSTPSMVFIINDKLKTLSGLDLVRSVCTARLRLCCTCTGLRVSRLQKVACSVVKPAFPVMTSRGRLLVVRLTLRKTLFMTWRMIKQKLTEREPRVQQPLVSHSDPTIASNFYIQSLDQTTSVWIWAAGNQRNLNIKWNVRLCLDKHFLCLLLLHLICFLISYLRLT